MPARRGSYRPDWSRPTTGSPRPPPRSRPVCRPSRARRSLSTIRKHGLKITVACNVACSIGASMSISSGTARKLGLSTAVRVCRKVRGKKKCTTSHRFPGHNGRQRKGVALRRRDEVDHAQAQSRVHQRAGQAQEGQEGERESPGQGVLGRHPPEPDHQEGTHVHAVRRPTQMRRLRWASVSALLVLCAFGAGAADSRRAWALRG